MAGIAVVAAGWADGQPVDVAGLARSVRTLAEAGWAPVVVTAPASSAPPAAVAPCLVGPPVAAPASTAAGPGGALTLALGESRAGRRAVPVVAHVLIDPLDPALAHPPAVARPEPLAVLEAEAIAALVKAGHTVVVADQIPVVPHHSARAADGGPETGYQPASATLDRAACARRVAGDLGAGVLAFVTGDGPPLAGDIDHAAAERVLEADSPWSAELLAAVRFLRAGGVLTVMTTPEGLPAALASTAAAPAGTLRVHRTLARPRPEAPVLAAGWC